MLVLVVLSPSTIRAEKGADEAYFPAVVFKGTVTHAIGSMFGYIDPQVGAVLELRFDEIEKNDPLRFQGGSYIPSPAPFKITDMDSFKTTETSAENVSRANGWQWRSLRAVADGPRHRVTLDMVADSGHEVHEDATIARVLIEYNDRIIGFVEMEGRIYRADQKPEKSE